MTDKKINVNPDRICEAIAKIGYTPQSAILDIADNGVSAGANLINIYLKLKDGAAFHSKNGIEEITIFDDGKGMSLEGINNAFDFGAEVEYEKNSLSKYGLGLKSAGFSLGRRITVISKSALDGEISARKLDRDEIIEKGLVSSSATPSQEHLDFLSNVDSGTIVVLSNLRKGIPSAKRIESQLSDVIGTTYLGFLTRATKPLEIYISYNKHQNKVEPRDMLFWDEAQDSYNPDQYDPLKPVKSLNVALPHPEDKHAESINVKVALFPRADCYQLSKSDEEVKSFKKYQITNANKGLYIYRNGRLIRWAEKPESLSLGSRELIGFRCVIEFFTDHDDYFHVDVSKQELEFPEDFVEKLSRELIRCKDDCEDIYARTGLMLSNQSSEGEEFNSRTQDFEEEDFDEIDPTEVKEVNKRRKKQEEDSQKELPKPDEKETDKQKEVADEEQIFQKVRYSDQVNGMDLWSSHIDAVHGTYVLVNKRHPFYSMISRIPPSDNARLAIESLIFCMASGFYKTARLSAVELDTVNSVHSMDKRYISQLLGDWVLRNQDLN